MSPSPLTTDDFADLLRIFLDRPTSLNGEDVFTLEQVAAKTKISQRLLERQCRSGVLEHTHVGNLRGMTGAQIAKMVAQYATGGDLGHRPADDELEQARSETRKGGASRRRRAA